MGDIYCKYCYKHWKLKTDYNKHLTCCEFFYYFRRNPDRLMDEHGVKIPTQLELFQLVQTLAQKCDKLEREVKNLKTNLSSKQRKQITEWINHPSQTPSATFEDWWHQMKITKDQLQRVFTYDLTEGMKDCIKTHVEQTKISGQRLPIRAFAEKHGVFYIYTHDPEATHWRTVTATDMERLLTYLSQLFLREFLAWQKEHAAEYRESEEKREQEIVFMIKINGLKVSTDKRLQDVKKWLFPLISETVSRVQIDF